MPIERTQKDGVPVLRLQSRDLEVDVAPEVGGRVIRLYNRQTGHSYLWTNPSLPLERLAAGSEYDPHFYGGIDELLPNDIPEAINGVSSPDHGELWTLPLDHCLEGDSLVLRGRLSLSGLRYTRRMTLRPQGPELLLEYRVENPTASQKIFLWKFHAALSIQPGDQLLCPAQTAAVADPAYSRRQDPRPFSWAEAKSQGADLVPPLGSGMDFLYLYDLEDGYMGWRRPGRDLAFLCRFDRAVFPYCWYFASYGGFFGHYTAVLEPCTAMPCSVQEAASLGQCSVLEPGQALETTVRLYAGTERGAQDFLAQP